MRENNTNVSQGRVGSCQFLFSFSFPFFPICAGGVEKGAGGRAWWETYRIHCGSSVITSPGVTIEESPSSLFVRRGRLLGRIMRMSPSRSAPPAESESESDTSIVGLSIGIAAGWRIVIGISTVFQALGEALLAEVFLVVLVWCQ